MPEWPVGPQFPFPPGSFGPSMQPPDLRQQAAQVAQGQAAYARCAVAQPQPWLYYGPNIGHPARDFTVQLLNGTVNVEAQTANPWRFDVPGSIIALTGSCHLTTGAGFPVGWSPLDSFKVRINTVNGQEGLIVQAAHASNVLGTGALPRYLPLDCWKFDVGAVFQVFVTPLIANLDIDVTAWVVFDLGPTNVTPIK